MTEDMIAQACAKIERLQASNDEYRRQVDALTAKLDEQGKQLAQVTGQRDDALRTVYEAGLAYGELAKKLAAREATLSEARGHVTELREGFCVYACPDEGHLATCVNASRWLK
jgi:chromosome segregation ATPase